MKLEINLSKEKTEIAEVLLEVSAELPFEGEFSVPDYRPEIFRIIRTTAKPMITQEITSGKKVTIEGFIQVGVLYLADESNRICGVNFRVPFTKQIELKKEANGSCPVFSSLTVSYLNCRAANRRRLEVRGAADLAVRVLNFAPKEFVCDAVGNGIQQKTATLSQIFLCGRGERQFSLDETLDLGEMLPDEASLLHADAWAVVTATEADGEDVLVEGTVHAILSAFSETGRISRYAYEIPFRQAVALDGALPADGSACASAEISSCLFQPEADGSVEFSATCRIKVFAFQACENVMVEDVYSIKCETQTFSQDVSLLCAAVPISTPFHVTATVPADSSEKTMDWFVESAECIPGETAGNLFVKGTACCIIGEENMICADTTFETNLSIPVPDADWSTENLSVCIHSVECSSGVNGNSLRISGTVSGFLFGFKRRLLTTGVSLDENHKKVQGKNALVVRYAEEGESIWEIAKTYNAPLTAVMEENGITADILEEKKILLIPMSAQ